MRVTRDFEDSVIVSREMVAVVAKRVSRMATRDSSSRKDPCNL